MRAMAYPLRVIFTLVAFLATAGLASADGVLGGDYRYYGVLASKTLRRWRCGKRQVSDRYQDRSFGGRRSGLVYPLDIQTNIAALVSSGLSE
jgi:hypothetical protein